MTIVETEETGHVEENTEYINSPYFLLSVSRNPNQRPQNNTYYLKSQIKLKNKNKVIFLLCKLARKDPLICPGEHLMMKWMYWITTRKKKSYLCVLMDVVWVYWGDHFSIYANIESSCYKHRSNRVLDANHSPIKTKTHGMLRSWRPMCKWTDILKRVIFWQIH